MRVTVTFTYHEVPPEIALALVPEGFGGAYGPQRRDIQDWSQLVPLTAHGIVKAVVQREETDAECETRRDAESFDREMS